MLTAAGWAQIRVWVGMGGHKLGFRGGLQGGWAGGAGAAIAWCNKWVVVT